MIPTGYHLHQEKFNIRSPYVDGDDYVYFVDSTEGGYVNFHIITNGIFTVSYGRSPGLDNFDNIYAHNVDSYGDISNYAKPNNTVTDSCGIK